MRGPLGAVTEILDGAVSRTVRSLRARGTTSTIRMARTAIGVGVYDFRRGIYTIGRAHLGDLDVAPPEDGQYHDYEAVNARAALTALRRLHVPTDGAFVDIGCGRGRMLIIALEYGFQHVIGVEISKILCAEAEENLSRFRRRMSSVAGAPVTRIVNADATKYTVDDRSAVFFFYIPFDENAMRAVLTAIEESVKRSPRDVRLIYYVPEHRRLLEENPFWAREQEEPLGFTSFVMYRSTR